jgi:glycine oxidase
VTDVVVAGAGLIGLSVAWRSAQRGLSVTVVDDFPGTGASYAAAGMLAPVTEAAYGEEALLRLCQASLERFPRFLAELMRAGGTQVGLRTSGTLLVGFDEDDVRALDALQAFQQELGLEAQRLTGRESRRREPSLTPRVRGGLHVPGDHSVEPRALHAALLAAATAAGVRVVRSRIEAVRIEDGRATGLVLTGGREQPGTSVVLALGARSTTPAGVPPLPVRPVKGQILRLRGAAGLLAGTVRALVRGRQVYLVPYADGGLVVGATVEDRGHSRRRARTAARRDRRRPRGQRAGARRDARPLAPGQPRQRPVARPLASGGARAGHRPLPQRCAADPGDRGGDRGAARLGRAPHAGRPLHRRPVREGGDVQLTVNGGTADVEDGATVATVVAEHGGGHRRVAVAVNGEVVPRSRWAATGLTAGDAVEVLTATAGG